MSTRYATWLATVLTAALIFGVLRDPPWLESLTQGFYEVEGDEDGGAIRWTAGRASFFVPATAERLVLELAGPDASDVTVTISIDGRDADRVTLDHTWRTVTLVVNSRPTSRRYRRIDLHCNRVIGTDFLRGVRVRWPPA